MGREAVEQPSVEQLPRHSTSTAVVAGIVTGVVGFTSTFAVVLTGLRAVGASADQAASGSSSSA